MSAHCQSAIPATDSKYRRVLWIALLVNGGMWLLEVVSGLQAGSVSLLADAVDFFADAANYGISLWVLSLSLVIRARASLFKAYSMLLFGLWVLVTAMWNIKTGLVPHALTMGVVAILALLANVSVAVLLYRHRNGDSNRRSVWLCSRNDAIANIAILFAAVGVFGTESIWPDIVVAVTIASLALISAIQIIRLAKEEIDTTKQPKSSSFE